MVEMIKKKLESEVNAGDKSLKETKRKLNFKIDNLIDHLENTKKRSYLF